MNRSMQLPDILLTISNVLQTYNANAILVGGCVRDHYLQLAIKDYDVEVYGLEKIKDLEQILSKFGTVNLVGKSFGVLKFQYNGCEYDFSFPRREKKTGKGHSDFDVEVDGEMDFKSAALRRDFTINAMGYDIKKDIFIDPFNGLRDLKDKKLRAVNSLTFIEDPLRVYRAVQFCARFDFVLSKETFVLCQSMVKSGMLDSLPKERVYEEFKKLLLKSAKPSIGFELMRELGILNYFVELKAIIDVQLNKVTHPEGNLWNHIMMSIDIMAKLLDKDEKRNLVLMFATLCHDFGKAITNVEHAKIGVNITRDFLLKLTNEEGFINRVLPLVEYHFAPKKLYNNLAKDSQVRRLATKVNIQELIKVSKADFLGRDTKEAKIGIFKAGDWLLKKAKELKVDKKPLDNLLRGKDLISLGLKPSPMFKNILDNLYELQLDGVISTKNEALDYVGRHLFNDGQK